MAYFDANNMLFTNEDVRKLKLGHEGRKAEILLEDIIKKFTIFNDSFSSLIIFDYTKNKHKYLLNANKNLELEVVSARPQYETSDDMLVGIACQLDEN